MNLLVSDLIVNICILITFTFVWHQLFRRRRLTFQSPLWVKVCDGVLAGVLGIILMHYSIGVNEITILDLRHVPVALVALYGGIIPPLIAAVVISIGRYIIDVNFSSHVALFMMLLIGLGSGIISYYVKMTLWKKWIVILLYSQAIFSIALFIVAPVYLDVLDFAILHVVFTLIGGILAFYFVKYIRRNSELFLKYQEYSRKDSLTNLFNVRSFYHYYHQYLNDAKEKGTPLILIMLDIDRFKTINDTYGHMAGDEILKQLATLIKNEAGDDAITSRNGGEEFSIMYSSKNIDEVYKIAEHIRSLVAQTPFQLPNKKVVQLTVSMGIAQYEQYMQSDFALYQVADNALYEAKNKGRNRIVIKLT